jgi:hypothetical protein
LASCPTSGWLPETSPSFSVCDGPDENHDLSIPFRNRAADWTLQNDPLCTHEDQVALTCGVSRIQGTCEIGEASRTGLSDETKGNDNSTSTVVETNKRPSGTARRNSDVAEAGTSHDVSDCAEKSRDNFTIGLKMKTNSDAGDIGINSGAEICRMSVIVAHESGNSDDGNREIKSTCGEIGRKSSSDSKAIGDINNDISGVPVTLPDSDVGPLLGARGDRNLVGNEDSLELARLPSNIYEAEQALRIFDCSSKWGQSSSDDRCVNPRILFRSFLVPHPSKIPPN